MRVLLVLLCLIATESAAGAWPRARGEWFLAPSMSVSKEGAQGSFYAEYGLTHWMTLGVDAALSTEQETMALVFARLPLWTGRKGHRFAMELGAGVDAGLPVVRSGLSYGQGLTTRWGPGWLALDANAAMNLGTGEYRYKLDATLGLTPSERWKAILQLQSSLDPDGSFTLMAAPSVTVRLSRSTQLEIGLKHPLKGARVPGVKLGLWLEF